MLDIALIREKPEWVKEQILKLNDPDAAARIDLIAELDKQRRALLMESEAIQSGRNKLNKNIGRLRGDRQIDSATRATRAAEASRLIEAGNYDGAAALMTGEAAVTPDTTIDADKALAGLNSAVGALGGRVEDINVQIKDVEAKLDENMSWLPNIPHESVPVFPSEESNIAWTPEGEFFEFDFQPKAHWD